MGDAGEAWIDAETRIRERIEEMEQERANAKAPARKSSEESRQIASLDLARRELERQLQTVTHPMRRAQLDAAIRDIDRRIAELRAPRS
jgi:hypothetical protein